MITLTILFIIALFVLSLKVIAFIGKLYLKMAMLGICSVFAILALALMLF